MGYDICRSLSLEGKLPEKTWDQEMLVERIHSDIEKKINYALEDYTRWDEQDRHSIMKEISLNYPDVVLVLHWSGDEDEDKGYEYFCNGKVQVAPAELVYPDFDETLLV